MAFEQRLLALAEAILDVPGLSLAMQQLDQALRALE